MQGNINMKTVVVSACIIFNARNELWRYSTHADETASVIIQVLYILGQLTRAKLLIY